MHYVIYAVLAIISFFVTIGIMSHFLEPDPESEDDVSTVLIIGGVVGAFWPLGIILVLCGFGGYAVIKRYSKKQ